jgi:hypothetical protein
MLNLQTASPSQFDEAFTKAFPGAENVIRKSKTFFLAAATEAKIPVSPYIMRNKKPRSGAAKKRQPKSNGGKSDKIQGQTGTGANQKSDNTPDPPKLLSQQLLEVLDMQKMQPEEVEAVWALLKYLRKEGK